MSEGADSIAHTCENSLTTLRDEGKPNEPPPATTYTGRRPRFGTGNVPASPFIWIDGKQLRSALAYTKKWPPRRVSFPTNDTLLVTGYLEPANPWRHAENVSREELISAYKESCLRHSTDPLENVLTQLENIDISDERCDELSLKGECLDQNNPEPLEEILKRVQFNRINLEGTSLSDESSVILFDMLEYYESAKQLNISFNQDIGARGWQACSHMIKKTQCLEQLEAKDVMLNEQYMNVLSRALRLVCHLHVLKLENCGLSGRCVVILVTALKMNTGIRELYLADNGLDLYDAIQLGSLLRLNNHIQLLDISNNNIQDDGVRDILEGLINQVNEDKDGKGLSILILWNNRLTHKSSPSISRIISFSKTLETLNVGQNMLTNETLITIKEALTKNRILLQLGMQSTDITCEGIVALSEVMEHNKVLQRIDLRDNSIEMTGMRALTSAMKQNKSITQIDLDDKPRTKIDGTLRQYMDLVDEVRGYCVRNKSNRQMEESNEDFESLQKHSRPCNASSRKISLTCQTLPSSSSSITSITANEPGRSMLEPKRTSGGRLRSPAPSPIPSPVASPIPSPSRSRFVVSRVSEASLRSTDSSASSSPVTPPSFGSLSPCFFPPSSSGSSRFRVSIVEPATSIPSPKPVAASKANVTVGFNFTVDSVESVDSDDSVNALKSDSDRSGDLNNQNACTLTTCRYSSLPDPVIGNDSVPSVTALKTGTNENVTSDKNIINVNADGYINNTTLESEQLCDRTTNQYTRATDLTNVLTADTDWKDKQQCADPTYNTPINNINEENAEVVCTVTNNEDKCTMNESSDIIKNEAVSSEQHLKKDSTMQKHVSNLDKLLTLFQHPGTFFSESANINQTDSRNPLQESVNSMMAFGDKFHQYFKESRGFCKNNAADTSAQSSNSTASLAKAKLINSLNMTQLSSIQSLTNMFTSFKLDSNVNFLESKNCSHQDGDTIDSSADEESQTKLLKNIVQSFRDVQETYDDEGAKLNIYNAEEETRVSNLNTQLLPENVQSKDNDGHTSKDLVLGINCFSSNTILNTCSKSVNNTTSINVPESKVTACVPKLKNIPEYSVLVVSDNKEESECIKDKLVKRIDSMRVENICDRSSTDSINLTSDSNSSLCNISCDIKVIDNVNTINEPDNIQEPHLRRDKEDLGESSTHVKDIVCGINSDFNVNNASSANYNILERNGEEQDYLQYQVTKRCYSDNNIDKETFIDSCAMLSEAMEEINTCQVDNLPHNKSTTVSSNIKLSIPDVSFTTKDNSSNFYNNSLSLHQYPLELCKDELSALVQKETSERLATDNTRVPTPNNLDHDQIMFKNKEVNKCAQTIDDNIVENKLECAFMPSVIIPHQDNILGTVMESDKEHSFINFEKSDTEDLIFCITDISTDGISTGALLSPGITSQSWVDDTIKTANSCFDLSQTFHSPTNLVITNSETVHRNSQDSGIEETNLSTYENIPENIHPHPRENLQESVDSGIESECSSVCVKIDSSMDTSKEALILKKTLHDTKINTCGRIHDLSDFESDSVEDSQRTTPDTISNISHSCLQMIKCAVTTSSCGASKTSRMDSASIGITSDENGIVLAEPSTIVHTTSPE